MKKLIITITEKGEGNDISTEIEGYSLTEVVGLIEIAKLEYWKLATRKEEQKCQ